jgi:hypothetical protein
MPKGYWMTFGQLLEFIGKPLGNDQIPAVSQLERRWNFTAVIRKNMAISVHVR